MLEKIFEDFGLIVCGWSGDWDPALRNAIERTISRRYTHFWAIHKTSDAASRLIEHRKAESIQIEDADHFFSELNRLVKGLNEFSRPHPLSTEAAVASLKSYLTDPQHNIRLHDLISNEVDKILKIELESIEHIRPNNKEGFNKCIRAYEAACETLIAMAATGGFWAEDWHYDKVWKIAIERLATCRLQTNLVISIEIQRYPATLLFYALGIGAVAAGDKVLPFIGKMFDTLIDRPHKKDKTAVELLSPLFLFSDGIQVTNTYLEADKEYHFKLNERLYNLFYPNFIKFFPSRKKFQEAVNTFEILIALGVQRKHNDLFSPWGIQGETAYKHEERDNIINKIEKSIKEFVNISPFVKSKIFGNSDAECQKSIDNVRDVGLRARKQFFF